MSALPEILPIKPFTQPVNGEAVIPGSKSLTNRALMLAALCDTPVTLRGALFSEDTELMAKALRQMGVSVESDQAGRFIRLSGQSQIFQSEGSCLFVGLAGTAARFLTALCATVPRGTWKIDGVPQMRKRPMKGLIEALRQLGTQIRCTGQEGFLPIEIHAKGLRGGTVSIDASESSQLLSALLMVAPLADAPVEVSLAGKVRWPFVQMTTRLMEHFGQAPVERMTESAFRIANRGHYRAPEGGYLIEPDATAASYFLALPAVAGGALRLPGLRGPGGGLQGDSHFVDVLRSVGVSIDESRNGLASSFAKGADLAGIERDFGEFSDTFLTLAALSPLFKSPTRITGIAHTRKQETDRVAGMARELRRLGQDVVEEEGALAITPRPMTQGVEIETYGDHRFAMSFAILGCFDLRGDGRPWLSIVNPGCCTKTFPGFFELLDQVRENSNTG
ncbi:MAG: 3-phosphoshikimate 1-carboxyvinyltransferase [Opitutaceae bacterium]|jgi:3-phosphoshikimate 1-carboxyvinyltransferase